MHLFIFLLQWAKSTGKIKLFLFFFGIPIGKKRLDYEVGNAIINSCYEVHIKAWIFLLSKQLNCYSGPLVGKLFAI